MRRLPTLGLGLGLVLVLVLALAAACGDDGGGPGPDAGRTGDAAASDAAPDAVAPPGDGGPPALDGGGSLPDALPPAPDALPPAPDALPPAPDAGPPPARDRLAYVSVGAEPRLAVVTLGAEGSLTARPELDLALPGNPGAMAYARAARRLYVGFGRGSLATVALDDAGRPSLLGRTDDLPEAPVYVAAARADALVVTAYFGADALLVHDVTGAPPHAERMRLSTADEPHAALVDPAGARVYVPHRNGNVTRWFDLPPDGALSPAGELAGEPGVGPRHIAFTPDGAFAYVVHEYADSVGAHRVSTAGALERFQTISTLPGGASDDANTCADIHVTPDGRFVYASNRGHDSLAMYAIAADGSLSFLGTVPTEARPRELDVAPDGRFVVAAGQDSGFLQSYRVEPDGTLTSVARLRVGDDLRWVIID